jgi:hypothetical protein
MKDLLKEAIADAKAVRETALANAKLALEEAFAPRIQSMISSHLQQEAEEEMMDEEDDDMTAMGDSEAPAEEMPMDGEMEAPVEDEMSMEAPVEDEMMDEEDDMDLEEIIRELEMSSTDSEEDPMAEADDEEMTEADDEMMDEGEDEEIDIQEVIRALREEDEEPMKEADAEKEEMEENLQEAYTVIKFLRSKINEVNLLNAKLLYSNKLFRTYSLNEGQKLKVIENFDRAQNLREVKLLFTALAENFTGNRNKKAIKESFASKPVGSTKPAVKTVINEGDDLANRFKKLAGLIK